MALIMQPAQNRETWLEEMTKQFVIPHFSKCGFEYLEFSPMPIKFSVSFIEGVRSSGKKMKTIGAHYSHHFSTGGEQHILIHPSLENSNKVVGVLIHELIHAQLPTDAGHGKEFRNIALKVGLCGKMTATEETEELQEKISSWVKKLGDYPHTSFDVSKSRKKQTTRMLKTMCMSDNEHCGNGHYKTRMSRSLIENFGAPFCPNCANQMEVEE
jgi:hypothetical protein